MATVTVTCATSLVQPRSNFHNGVTSQYFEALGVTFGGATDVMRLARLPNQARILDISGMGICAATSFAGVIATAEVLASGTLSIRDTICSVSVVTAGGPLKTGTFTPTKVSLSDDAAVQYAMLAIKLSAGTQSTSVSIRGVVLYETGGNDN